jgi:hypothetical protein
MSNFICPHCQQIIDDGSDGFTSNREIELEKKLEIAVKAINSAAEYLACMDDLSDLNNGKCNEQMALETLNKALAKIKEIK